MSSGTRIVVVCVLFAAAVFAVLEIYGIGALERRDPDSPAMAARLALQADNTVVGLIGGIVSFEPVAEPPGPRSGATRLEARVMGARDSGRLAAELSLVDGRWTVGRATFTTSAGVSIPVAGSAGR